MPTPESSTEDQNLPAQAGAAEEAANQGDNQAGSSAAEAEGDKGPATLFDAVKAAIAGDRAEEAPTSEDQEHEDAESTEAKPGDKAEGEAEGDDEELNEDDLARLSKKTRKSVRRLLRDRATARAEVEQLRPQAEQYEKINRFIDEAGLASQEVAAGFNIMRAMKHEPEKALELLAPYVQELMRVTGRLVPADIQEQVRTGQIDQRTAQELSETRARAALATSREQQTREAATRREQNVAHTQAVDVMANAVSAREQHYRTSDPDYAVKHTHVIKAVRLAIHEGRIPRTPEEAVALVDECKQTVDAELKRFQPRRQPVTPVSGGSSPSAAPKPSSTLEAIKRVVAA